MDITVSSKLPARPGNSCHVVMINDSGALPSAAASVNTDSDGAIARAVKRGDISGANGSSLILHELPGHAATRLLLMGAGKRGSYDAVRFRALSESLTKALHASGATLAIVDITRDLDGDDIPTDWQCHQLALALIRSTYRYQGPTRTGKPAASGNSGKTADMATSLKKVVILVNKDETRAAGAAVRDGVATANGMSVARELGNLPPNVCTPDYLAKAARSLCKQHNSLSCKVLDEAQMGKLNMGALLAVSQGSRQPARLICIEHKGGKKSEAPVVLIGKGVTFDTGGISIKPSATMDEMKYDMCGAASVFGVMSAVAERNMNRNVIGVVAAAENMPDGNACRPGDVVTTMSGQTVEILNTDAEGRLVMCDALTYVERYKPAAVIDIATLTGACVVALGNVGSGVMGNDQPLIDALRTAGDDSGDRCWQLPMWDDYQSQLDSNFADMANIGGRAAGAITAACFLSRFADKFAWAHLDIAGVAWQGGSAKGASGRPVPLLMRYLQNRK